MVASEPKLGLGVTVRIGLPPAVGVAFVVAWA
jgi:hypothetical protein